MNSRVLQVAYKLKVNFWGHILSSYTIKPTYSLHQTNTSENELQDSNLSHKIKLRRWGSVTKPTVYPAIHKSNASTATNVYAIHRRAKNELHCEWQFVTQIPEMEN